MKKIMMIAAGAIAVSATPALAASPGDSANYPVSASVAAKCTTQTPSTNELDFGPLGTNADGTLDSATYSVSYDQASFVCNGAATTIAASATALTNGGTATSDFTDTINYKVTIDLGSFSNSFTTPSSLSSTTLGAKAGTLKITADSLAPSSGLALLSGAYTGTITVVITPGA